MRFSLSLWPILYVTALIIMMYLRICCVYSSDDIFFTNRTIDNTICKKNGAVVDFNMFVSILADRSITSDAFFYRMSPKNMNKPRTVTATYKSLIGKRCRNSERTFRPPPFANVQYDKYGKFYHCYIVPQNNRNTTALFEISKVHGMFELIYEEINYCKKQSIISDFIQNIYFYVVNNFDEIFNGYTNEQFSTYVRLKHILAQKLAFSESFCMHAHNKRILKNILRLIFEDVKIFYTTTLYNKYRSTTNLRAFCTFINMDKRQSYVLFALNSEIDFYIFDSFHIDASKPFLCISYIMKQTRDFINANTNTSITSFGEQQNRVFSVFFEKLRNDWLIKCKNIEETRFTNLDVPQHLLDIYRKVNENVDFPVPKKIIKILLFANLDRNSITKFFFDYILIE